MRNTDRDEAIKEGLEQGFNQGIEKGLEQGSNNRANEIAKNMLKAKMSISEIAQLTGLSENDIMKIKSED